MLQWTLFTNPHVSFVKFSVCWAKVNVPLPLNILWKCRGEAIHCLWLPEERMQLECQNLILIPANKSIRIFFKNNRRSFQRRSLGWVHCSQCKPELLFKWSHLCAQAQVAPAFVGFSLLQQVMPGRSPELFSKGVGVYVCLSPAQQGEEPHVWRQVHVLYLPFPPSTVLLLCQKKNV
jgi:hypothetical protein